MASTTSLKLPEDVKKLATAVAKKRGVTTHAFMVEAIRSAANSAEKRAAFLADAEAARAETLKSGKGYAAEDVHAYLRARVQRMPAAKPKAKPWRG